MVGRRDAMLVIDEALLPAPHCRVADAGLAGHLRHRQTLVRQQHDLPAENVGERTPVVVNIPAQGASGLRREHEGYGLGHAGQVRTFLTRSERSDWFKGRQGDPF